MDGITNIYIDSPYISKFGKYRYRQGHSKNIDMAILENIDIDRAVLENIDIDIDKEILENIDIDLSL